MKPNHAEIYRVGNLEPDFQQVTLIQFFPKFSQYCCERSIIQIQQRKVKTIFLDKNSKKKKKKKKKKKNHFTIENAWVRPTFGRKFNFSVNI